MREAARCQSLEDEDHERHPEEHADRLAHAPEHEAAHLVKYHSSGLRYPYAFGVAPARFDWNVINVPGDGCQKSGSWVRTASA